MKAIFVLPVLATLALPVSLGLGLGLGCSSSSTDVPSTTSLEPAPPPGAEDPTKAPPVPLAAPRPIDDEPLPGRVAIWMTPHDHAVDAAPLLRIGVRGEPVRRGVRALRAIAGDVRLLTWPELTPVDARVDVVAPDAYEVSAEVDATATIHPAAPLAPRSYVLTVRSSAPTLAPVLAKDVATLDDGSLGVRFEVRAAAAADEARAPEPKAGAR